MKILVTINLQTVIEALTDSKYQEAIYNMIQHLEEHGFTVNIESEKTVDE